MTGLSDDAQRLLRAGQTALMPERQQLEATRAALEARLGLSSGSGFEAANSGPHPSGLEANLEHSAQSLGLVKLTLLSAVVAGL